MTTAPTTEPAPAETAATAEPPVEATLAAPTGGLSLRKNFSWTFVGNVVYAACQWGILVVLAKLGTPEMVGQFALGLAITAPVMMFSMLQLRGVQATDAKREYQFGDYLALRLITTALALVVIVGIVAVSGYKRETALVILIVGAMKGVDALSDVYYGLWQQHERMDGIAQALMLNGVVSTAALVALMAATHNIVLAVLGTATGSVGALLFTLARNRRLALATGSAARPHFQTSLLWRLTRVAFPLGVCALLISLNPNIPRYAIQRYMGASQLGLFAAAAYVLTAGTTVISALAQSASPRLARCYATGDYSGFWCLLRGLLAIGGALGVIGLTLAHLYGATFLRLLYGAQYSTAATVFTWLMAASALTFIAWFLNSAMLAVRHFAVQTPLFAIVSTVSAIASYALIPKYGILGAAFATVATYMVQVIGGAAVVMAAITKPKGITHPNGKVEEAK